MGNACSGPPAQVVPPARASPSVKATHPGLLKKGAEGSTRRNSVAFKAERIQVTLQQQGNNSDRRRMSVQGTSAAGGSAPRRASVVQMARVSSSVPDGPLSMLPAQVLPTVATPMEAPSSQGRRFSVLKAIETGKVPSPVVPDGFNAKMSERSSHFDFSNEADRQAAKQSTDSNRSEDEGSTSPKAGRMSYRHSSASDDDEPPAARRSYRVRAESIDDPMLMISSDPAAQALAAHLAIPEAVEEEEDDDTPEGGEEKSKEVDGPAPSQTGAPGGAKQQETATRESDTESDTAPSEAPVPLWREQQAAAEQAGSKDGSHRETRRRAASSPT